MWFRVVSVINGYLTQNISHTCSFILAPFSDGGPLAAGAALHTAAVVVSSTSSYMRGGGGGESQVEVEGQRSRAERSWRSKHWK